MVKHMAKDYNLFVPESKDGVVNAGETVINRRQFLRYGFNTVTGVLAASLGVLEPIHLPNPPLPAPDDVERIAWPYAMFVLHRQL